MHDPTDDGDYVIPIGKQTLRPSHIFYTPCSGIWQSVWIEPVPVNHITRLDLDANKDGQGKSFSGIRWPITNNSSQHDCPHICDQHYQQRES